MWLFLVFLFVLIIVIIAFKKRKSQEYKPTGKIYIDWDLYDEANNKPSDGFQKQAEWHPLTDGNDILTHLPLPKENLGFYNFPLYDIKAKKASTNRANHVQVRASSELAAKKTAMSKYHLMEPMEISLAPFQSSDIKNEWGVFMPKGASSSDQWDFTYSCENNDGLHIPVGFQKYMTSKGVAISWMSGRKAASRKLFEEIGLEDRTTLYVYAVYCSVLDIELGNIEESEHYEDFVCCAKEALSNKSVHDSIKDRTSDELWYPSKRSIAYKFVVKYFFNH